MLRLDTLLPTQLSLALYDSIKVYNRDSDFRLTRSAVDFLSLLYECNGLVTLRGILRILSDRYESNRSYQTLMKLVAEGNIDRIKKGTHSYYSITAKGIALLVLVNDMTERIAKERIKKLRKLRP